MDTSLLPARLATWDLPGDVPGAVVADLAPPEAPEIAALYGWVHGAAVPEGEPRAEADWDRLAGKEAPDPWAAADRRVAALYLLPRLGEKTGGEPVGRPAAVLDVGAFGGSSRHFIRVNQAGARVGQQAGETHQRAVDELSWP